MRRRTKTIVHAFKERAVLKLMYSALIRATEGWRGHLIFESIPNDPTEYAIITTAIISS